MKSASYLDLHLEINGKGKLLTKLHDTVSDAMVDLVMTDVMVDYIVTDARILFWTFIVVDTLNLCWTSCDSFTNFKYNGILIMKTNSLIGPIFNQTKMMHVCKLNQHLKE